VLRGAEIRLPLLIGAFRFAAQQAVILIKAMNEHWLQSVCVVMWEATSRPWKQLAQERIENEKPVIPLGKRFWRLSAEERAAIDELFCDGAAAQGRDGASIAGR
jgi:hypothetical protein